MENIESVDPVAISRFHELVGNAKNGSDPKSPAQITGDKKIDALKAFSSQSNLNDSVRSSRFDLTQQLSHTSQRSSVLELA